MATITAGTHYRSEVFDDATLSHQDLQECVFVDCSFIGAKLTETKCNNVVFRNCNFQAAKVDGADFFMAEFRGCKLLGVDFSNKSRIFGTTFEDCILDYANFRGVDLQEIRFTHCSCMETDFSLADLTRAVFDRCELKDIGILDTHFEQTDLHTSTLSGMDLYSGKLRGLMLSAQQFLMLAPEIGITIIDEEIR